jgi:hypothetical protein
MTKSAVQAKRLKQVLLLLLVLVLSSGCAHHYTPENFTDPYGFFSGIWHGMVFPYSLFANIVSWALSILGVDFLSSVQIIGRPNTGLFYYVGFFFGLSAYGGAATSGSRGGA